MFSLFFRLYPVFHESHTVYLRTTVECEVEDYAVLFSTKRLHWHNPYLNTSFIYTCTGAHNPYPHLCTGYTGRNYDMYLGLGMRYESEIWTIVISMNRAFKWCQFCCGLNFNPKSWKTMDYSLCLSAIFGKNVTVTNNHFYDIIWKLFWCWSQW